MASQWNSGINIPQFELEVLRDNQSQGRAFEDLEPSDVVFVLLEELSLLWLCDRSVMTGLPCPRHIDSLISYESSRGVGWVVVFFFFFFEGFSTG